MAGSLQASILHAFASILGNTNDTFCVLRLVVRPSLPNQPALMPESVIDVLDLLFPPNPSIKRSLIAPIGGFTRFVSKPPRSTLPFSNLINATLASPVSNSLQSLSSAVLFQCVCESFRWTWM